MIKVKAYILRSFVTHLRPYQEEISDSVLALMQNCPSDDSVTRRELLVATRHILFTDFRMPFLKYVDLLLNEEAIVGNGLTSKETLRAYNTAAFKIAWQILSDYFSEGPSCSNFKNVRKAFCFLEDVYSSVSRHLREVGESNGNTANGSKLIDDSSLTILSTKDFCLLTKLYQIN